MSGGMEVAESTTAYTVVRNSRKFSWDQKRVLVTGGSEGLGFVIARQLASKGVRLAICAPTAALLHRAVADLQNWGGDVIGFSCDVSNESSVTGMFSTIDAEYGGVDIVFNVAGVVDAAILYDMTGNDFEESIATNSCGALRTIQAALPGMYRRGWGRIMNVAAVGGQRQEIPQSPCNSLPVASSPHISLRSAGYKGERKELSHGLQAGLKHENILVSTACPGLMRTGNPRSTMLKDQHREEYAWFSIGESLPLMSMNAEEAAAQIIEACQQGRGDFVVADPANLAAHLRRYFPKLAQHIPALMDQLLPEMGGNGREAICGYDSRSEWSPSAPTELTWRTALTNSEL